jgi:glucokinase
VGEISKSVALAVDIGGSKADMAIINSRGEVLSPIEKQAVPFDQNGIANPDGLIDLLADYLERNKDQAALPGAVGLSVCGNIDPDTGEAVLVPNLHWQNLPFGEMASKRLNLPIFPATDVMMAALAEAVWGAAREVRNFAWVTIGTGFGAYLWLEGKLYGGAHSFAGNFGHNTIDEINGYPCGCGRRGCLETFVAGPGIARAGQATLDEGRSQMLAELAGDKLVTTAMVFQAEAAGDSAAKEIVESVIRLTSIGIAGLVNTLDLEMIVLGGGVAHATPEYIPRIDRKVRDYLMTVEARRDLQVVRESMPNSALFGAAAKAFMDTGVLK